jgi:tetratricopeptide (TPR) repeat protein
MRAVDHRGPGLGPLLLIILAVALAVTALVLRLRRNARAEHSQAVQAAAPLPVPVPALRDGWSLLPDAGEIADAAVDATPHAWLVPRPPAPDAGARGMDEASAAARGDSVADVATRARGLYDKAQEALDEGEFARAYDLAEASLRLRKTARTYLLRAQAQQRLDRVEDALASIDAAAQLAPTSGTVWELRGRVLWAARRRDDARAAFEKFLELDPNSPKAAAVRRLMNEPR